MSRQVVFTKRARSDLERLDKPDRSRIVTAVERFAETGHGDIKRIVGTNDQFRLRVGNWRIRFTFGDNALNILRVLPRGSAYTTL